jgi:hypothetical protein
MESGLRRMTLAGAVGALTLFAAALLVGSGSAATEAAPTNTQPPTIGGTPEVGKTLTAREGTWTGDPTDYDYAWRSCDADGGSCLLINDAEQRTYVLRASDQGHTIRVRVTAQNADGRRTATSVPSAVIRAATKPSPPPPPPTDNPCDKTPVAANQLKPPERLLIAGQQVSPGVIGGSTQTIVARFRITACNGKPVQGALVYVTAVPYNMFSVPPEAQTGADGWAELRMNRQRGFPATPRQQLLVMFVRGREPGGNLLGGISTRRLVSFPVKLNS